MNVIITLYFNYEVYACKGDRYHITLTFARIHLINKLEQSPLASLTLITHIGALLHKYVSVSQRNSAQVTSRNATGSNSVHACRRLTLPYFPQIIVKLGG